MLRNNMTGDPNQQNPTSIFGYDAYPTQNIQNLQELSWTNTASTQFYHNPHNNQFNNVNMTSATVGGFTFGPQRPIPNLVQFPFGSNSGFGTNASSMRCKRKTDSPQPQTCKQHITEEKMAEHMSNLHISSETATSSTESESVRTQRLYMCEEMRKLKSDPILPQSLLDKYQRPCTAVVLWQPPPRLLPVHNVQQDEENYENNNEENLPDNNHMEGNPGNVGANMFNGENFMENVNNMDMDS